LYALTWVVLSGWVFTVRDSSIMGCLAGRGLLRRVWL